MAIWVKRRIAITGADNLTAMTNMFPARLQKARRARP